jgi:hypothetical protein
VTDIQTDRHESQEAGKTIVRCDLPIATDKKPSSLITCTCDVTQADMKIFSNGYFHGYCETP